MDAKFGSGLIILLSLIVAGISAQNLNLNKTLPPQPKQLEDQGEGKSQFSTLSPTLSLPGRRKIGKFSPSEMRVPASPAESTEDNSLAALYPQVFELKDYIRNLKREIEVLEIKRGLLDRDKLSPFVRQELASLEAQISADAGALENFKGELAQTAARLQSHLKRILRPSRPNRENQHGRILAALNEKTLDIRHGIRNLEIETDALQNQRRTFSLGESFTSPATARQIMILDAQIHANKTALHEFQADLADAEKARRQFLTNP